MPEVHHPHLEEDDEPPAVRENVGRGGRRAIGRLLLEVALITVGVFFGLAGEQWRETARHHELADVSLRRFRAELVENRKAVTDVQDYHRRMQKRLHAFFDADPRRRNIQDAALQGIRPVWFDHTAWDLAVATQSLIYLDTDLAFHLSQIYGFQQRLTVLGQGLTQAMYVHPPEDNATVLLASVVLYYDDAVDMEARLITMYDALLPQVDAALHLQPAAK